MLEQVYMTLKTAKLRNTIIVYYLYRRFLEFSGLKDKCYTMGYSVLMKSSLQMCLLLKEWMPKVYLGGLFLIV